MVARCFSVLASFLAALGSWLAAMIAAMDDIGEDLDDVLQLAVPRCAAARWEYRSPLLAQHARDKKENMFHKRKAEQATVLAEATGKQMKIVSQLPMVAHMLGRRASADKFSEDSLPMLERLAFASKLRARGNDAVAQAQAWSIIAGATVDLQREGILSRIGARCVGKRRSIAMKTVQFDEAQQKVQALVKRTLARERTCKAQSAVPIMVMGGFTIYASVDSEDRFEIESSPWFAKSLSLETKTANGILEALARGMPFFVDSARMVTFALAHDEVVLGFSSDRAEANFAALKWVFHFVRNELPSNVLPCLEVCGSHGCAIVKTRCFRRKELASSTFSLTRLMRSSANLQGLRAVIIARVWRELQFMERPRPPDLQRKGDAIIAMLHCCNTHDESYLWRTTRDGKRYKTNLCKDLEAFVKHVDITPGDPILRYWPEDAREFAGGARARENAQELAREKVACAILNLFMGYCWNPAQSGRWTHVTQGLKRIALLIAGKDVLGHALSDLRAHWRVESDIAALARILEQDSENFAARTQLRLLRVIQTFRKADVHLELACVLVAGKPVEDMLYKYLGFDKRRLSLLDWCNPHSSPICKGQLRLLNLMETFDDVREGDWALLIALGGDLRAESVRLHARRECLQLSGGLCEVFELRMSKPPYTWVLLCLPDISRETKARVAQQSLDEDFECLPLFCQRVRARYPSVPALMQNAVPLLETWARETMLSIDLFQRGRMRFTGVLATAIPLRAQLWRQQTVSCASSFGHHSSTEVGRTH